MKKINYTNIKIHIIEWMMDYVKSSNTNGFVIGVSGGIDSGVVSTLCAETGLPLLILEMPIHQSKSEVRRARKHIKWLKENYPNVKSQEIDLTETYETFKRADVKADVRDEQYEFTLSNTRSRLRMMTLYQFSGQLGYLVAGTGNKVEDFGIGFFTKGGDQIVDLSPIGDLMKSEVYSLGAELGLIDEILNAIPTDGLHNSDNMTDEDQIGASYPELECAMNFENKTFAIGDTNDSFVKSCWNINKKNEEEALSDREKEVLEIYRKMHSSNKHKMLPIPVCALKGF